MQLSACLCNLVRLYASFSAGLLQLDASLCVFFSVIGYGKICFRYTKAILPHRPKLAPSALDWVDATASIPVGSYSQSFDSLDVRPHQVPPSTTSLLLTPAVLMAADGFGHVQKLAVTRMVFGLLARCAIHEMFLLETN